MNKNIESHQPHIGKLPNGWKRSDDVIKEDAFEKLWRNQRIDSTGIQVKVDHGILTLEGVVDSEKTISEALICIEAISGVEEIINLLALRVRS